MDFRSFSVDLEGKGCAHGFYKAAEHTCYGVSWNRSSEDTDDCSTAAC